MTRLYLVRHGRATATFSEHPDPGLDDLGRQQAEATAARLATVRALAPGPQGPPGQLSNPMALLSSPLARAVETAAPLLLRWPQPLRIDVRVAEIPTDTSAAMGGALSTRGEWLARIMAGRWRDQSPALQAWVAGVVTCLQELNADTVIFSHFIAINAAVGAATGDDRVVVFRPDNASVTIIDTDGRGLRLIERGDEAATRVN